MSSGELTLVTTGSTLSPDRGAIKRIPLTLTHGDTFTLKAGFIKGLDLVWKLLALHLEATTTADVDNRIVYLKLKNAEGIVIWSLSSKAIPASQSAAGYWLVAALTYVPYNITGYANTSPLGIHPDSFKFQGDEYLEISADSTHAGDSFTIMLSLEQVFRSEAR